MKKTVQRRLTYIKKNKFVRRQRRNLLNKINRRFKELVHPMKKKYTILFMYSR